MRYICPIQGPIDYSRIEYEYREHHRRFADYVKLSGLPCQECGASGGYVEPVLDYGEGPWFECGWCEGTGKTTRSIRGFWLREKKSEKKK